MATLGGYASSFEEERGKKYTAGLSNLKEIMKLYGPDYGKGMEKTALAGIDESMISRGLGSTTRPAAMSVGMKANIEDMRRSKLAEALAMMAQYTQQSTPSPGIVSSTAVSANAALRNPGALSPTYQEAMKNFNMNPAQRWSSTPGNVGAYTGL